MEKFTSEVLSSGVTVTAVDGKSYDFLLKAEYGQWMKLTKSDINRLHGIAFPEKKHGCCQVVNNSIVGEQTNIETNNSDITL